MKIQQTRRDLPLGRDIATRSWARSLLTPQARAGSISADAASGAPPPASGLGVAAPPPSRAGASALSSEASSVSSIDASPPPRRYATRTHRRAARREEDCGGRPPRTVRPSTGWREAYLSGWRDLNSRPLDPQIGPPPLTSVNHLS